MNQKASELARCGICGEPFTSDDRAEMYDPTDDKAPSLIVHAECGLAKGWDVA